MSYYRRNESSSGKLEAPKPETKPLRSGRRIKGAISIYYKEDDKTRIGDPTDDTYKVRMYRVLRGYISESLLTREKEDTEYGRPLRRFQEVKPGSRKVHPGVFRIIRDVLSEYYDIFSELKDAHVGNKMISSTKEVEAIKPRDLWTSKQWNSLSAIITQSSTKIDLVDKIVSEAYGQFKKEMPPEERYRFDEILHNLDLLVSYTHQNIRFDPNEILNLMKKSAPREEWEKVGEEAMVKIGEIQSKVFYEFSKAISTLRDVYTKIFYAFNDAAVVITLDADQSAVFREQIEDMIEYGIENKLIDDYSQAGQSFIEGFYRRWQKMGDINPLLLSNRVFVGEVISKATEKAQKVPTTVQVFDNQGELLWLATPKDSQTAGIVAQQLRGQHIHLGSDWEWMLRGSNVILEGKTFQGLSPAQRAAMILYLQVETEKYEKWNALSDRSKAQYRAMVLKHKALQPDRFAEKYRMTRPTMDEIASYIKAEIVYKGEARLPRGSKVTADDLRYWNKMKVDWEQLSKAQQEKVEESVKKKFHKEIEEGKAKAKREGSIYIPNDAELNEYFDDLSGLHAIWQIPVAAV